MTYSPCPVCDQHFTWPGPCVECGYHADPPPRQRPRPLGESQLQTNRDGIAAARRALEGDDE